MQETNAYSKGLEKVSKEEIRKAIPQLEYELANAQLSEDNRRAATLHLAALREALGE